MTIKISLIAHPTEEDSDEELEYAEAGCGVTESLKNPGSVVENELNCQNGKKRQAVIGWTILECIRGRGYRCWL